MSNLPPSNQLGYAHLSQGSSHAHLDSPHIVGGLSRPVSSASSHQSSTVNVPNMSGYGASTAPSPNRVTSQQQQEPAVTPTPPSNFQSAIPSGSLGHRKTTSVSHLNLSNEPRVPIPTPPMTAAFPTRSRSAASESDRILQSLEIDLAKAKAEKLVSDQQSAISTIKAAQLALREGSTIFPPGAGTHRFLQMIEATRKGPSEINAEYWHNFAEDFYLPTGLMRMCLRNGTSGESKGLEVPSPVFARWITTTFATGVVSLVYSFDQIREYTRDSPVGPSGKWYPIPPPPPAASNFGDILPSSATTHVVEAPNVKITCLFDNGVQNVWDCHMRACMVPNTRATLKQTNKIGERPQLVLETQLRFETFDLTNTKSEGWFPVAQMIEEKIEQPLPRSVVEMIVKLKKEALQAERTVKQAAAQSESTHMRVKAEALDSHQSPGKGKDKAEEQKEGEERSAEDAKKEEEKILADFVASLPKVQSTQPVVPTIPVNEYGMSLQSMRCLEITESVYQLLDLMDFQMQQSIGPIEALRRFAANVEEKGGVPTLPDLGNPASAAAVKTRVMKMMADAQAKGMSTIVTAEAGPTSAGASSSSSAAAPGYMSEGSASIASTKRKAPPSDGPEGEQDEEMEGTEQGPIKKLKA